MEALFLLQFFLVVFYLVFLMLIDEARTPLIISGPGDKSTHLYTDAYTFVLTLKRPSKTQQEKTEEVKFCFFDTRFT